MDVIKLLNQRKEEVIQLKPDTQVDEVLRHLLVAEKHFFTGKELDDSDYFTDVVYRTNQVFEGILKEVFEVISGKSAQNKTPFDIEDYLIKEKAFSHRVSRIFTDYRKNWRNASTHDHRLDFTEQEAFIAISTVSTFCYSALSLMSYSLAKSKVSLALAGAMQTGSVEEFTKLIVGGLEKALPSLPVRTGNESPQINAMLLLGFVSGVVESLFSDATVKVEERFVVEGKSHLPDLFVQIGEHKIVIELKTIPLRISEKRIVTSGINYLKGLLDGKVADIGILIAFPRMDLRFTKFDYTILEEPQDAIAKVIFIRDK